MKIRLRSKKSLLVAAVVVVALVAAAIVVLPRVLHRDRGEVAEAVVSADGFTVALYDVVVTGGAGVAPAGTTVRLSRVPEEDSTLGTVKT